jgi:hypothetical protein
MEEIMSNINRAPGGKGSLASTGNYYDPGDGNQDTGKGNTMLAMATEKISDLYEGVEKPVGDLISKVGERMPQTLKSPSTLMMVLLPLFSIGLLLFGLFGMKSDNIYHGPNR